MVYLVCKKKAGGLLLKSSKGASSRGHMGLFLTRNFLIVVCVHLKKLANFTSQNHKPS